MDDPARRAWIVVVAVGLGIFVASVLPPAAVGAAFEALPLPGGSTGPSEPPPSVPPDKLSHAALYAVLTATAVRATVRTPSFRWPVATAAIGASAYGAGVELVQTPLAWRTGDPLDAAANAVGAAAVATAVIAVRAARERTTEGAA